ncbi:MAG: hypothetical protein GF329_19875 [Candidatus Lokiarchaeota archaeon]|nr:hypothetical protein [Candidatus Lokiarchaeota archaeon]
MPKRTEIEVSGLGGQGVITLSKLIASAVILHEDGKNAVQTEAYGAAARGWTCWGEVVMHDSEEMIDYPRAIPPYDILVVLSEAAATKYKKDAKKDGVVIYDSTTVRPSKVKYRKSKVYDVPAQEIAREEFQTVVSNVLLFGAIIGLTDVIKIESGMNTVKEFVPEKFLDLNINAYNRGVELGKSIKRLGELIEELEDSSKDFKKQYKRYGKGRLTKEELLKVAEEEYDKTKDEKFKEFQDLWKKIYLKH